MASIFFFFFFFFLRDYASSPDLTKDETLGHALDYKGNSISLSLVN